MTAAAAMLTVITVLTGPVARTPQPPAVPTVDLTEREAAAPASMSVRATVGTTVDWDALADCESGGDWQANTGNGYFGGLQFALSTWRAVGGTGMPHQASRETQIRLAERLLAAPWGGLGHWPACTRKLGWR